MLRLAVSQPAGPSLPLGSDVEAGGRFVGDQQSWKFEAIAMAIIARWHMPPESPSG